MSATAVSASAAVVACCVAVYVSVIRPRLKLPKLTMLPQTDDPHSLTYVTANDGWRGAWARIRVHNDANRDTAEDVQVMVVDILTPDNAQVESVGPLCGRLLKWAGHRSNAVSIPPGISVRYDLLEYGLHTDGTRLAKRVCIYPPSSLDSLNHNEFPEEKAIFVLVLCGKSINARFYRIEVECGDSWNGQPPAPISMTVHRMRSVKRHKLGLIGAPRAVQRNTSS